MKKLTMLVIAGVSIISLSAQANPPLGDGKWVGIYTSSYPDRGAGKAILIQKDAKIVDKGVTVFSSTLILENFQPVSASDPDYSKGVAGKSKIIYSGLFNYPGSALINFDQPDCKHLFQLAGNYDDAKKEIHSITNNNCGPRIDIYGLHYQPSAAKPASK